MELKACPSALNTKHEPYLASWDDQNETLICPTAQVKCACGFSGPERYGDSCRAEAIVAWNTRPAPSKQALEWKTIKDKIKSHKVILAETTHANKELKEPNKFVTGQMKDDGFYFEEEGEMSFNWNIVRWIYIDDLLHFSSTRGLDEQSDSTTGGQSK